MKLTASNIVSSISQLSRDRAYQYINPRTKGQIEIVHVTYPEGPIIIKRYSPTKGETSSGAKEESISTQMIWRIANAFIPNQPINFDRVLGGSYNTRSVLETLLAHTPQFYCCYPGRIEIISSSSQIKGGHKHLVWYPDQPHELGVIGQAQTETVISEIPNVDIFYDALTVPDDILAGDLDIDIQRRHAQMQIALIYIGQQLNYKIWIAQNDKGIIYNNKRIGEMDGVIASLQSSGTIISTFTDALRAALLIDCIWFKNARLMPAVIEIEHSTGVTSGLTRMKGLQDILPPFPTRYVIVAPDEDRDKVVREASRSQFRSLDARFFPYSSVEELYALCQRRKIRGVSEEFLDCYMEPIIQAS
jgi:type II restriction enzyme